MSLKKQAIKGTIWAYIQQFSTQIFTFIITIILARLISPEEFGLIGMITIFIALGTAFFDGGLINSLIVNDAIDEQDYSTVFFFNIFIAITIFFVLFFTSPYIAAFYDKPILTSLIRVYSLVFIFNSLGTIQNVILTKEMNFKKITFINLPALIISSILSIIMAYKGFGVWSLVFSYVLNSFFSSLFLWIIVKWKPMFIFNLVAFKIHFNFGYKLMLSNVLDIVYRNSYNVIIGKYFSAFQVGLYTNANSLIMLPIGNISGAINRVALPMFSVIKDDNKKLKEAYKRIIELVFFIVLPIMMLIFVLAEEIILFFFTEKWLNMTEILRILSLSAIFYPIHYYNLLILQIKGKTGSYLKLEVIKKIIQTIIIIFSVFFGFKALLWGQVIFSVLALFVNTFYTSSILKYSMINQIIDVTPLFIITALIGVLCFYLNYSFDLNSIFLIILLFSSFGISMYFCVTYFFKISSFFELKKILKYK